ncbi:hereditary hemochromatosis protein homolog isoform X2 [Misgurnus anguillicaudatus]|uniref:hereditary hemochromatosis protein homolog isoform X2 n=1 Tax=Misgurnus anguillicaudatus TaxID=75329 RepID=UPI003CCF3ABA
MIIADAFQGSTLDELHWYNGTIKYTSQLETDFKKRLCKAFENVYYPLCIKALKVYLEKRGNQVNRRVKPKVHIIQTLSGSRVMCLATGFYPRHINLTLFRDGQQVSDDDITGGDLLPNDDGTYQMRKILTISEKQQREKHKYTCTVTHLSLDNKLNVTFEYDGTLLKPVLSSVLTVVVLMIGIVFAVILCKKQQAASKEGVSSPKGSLTIISLRSQSSDV